MDSASDFECCCCGGSGSVPLYGACPLCDGEGTDAAEGADDTSDLWAVAKAIASYSTDDQDDAASDFEPPFRAEEIAGKGVGVRASRLIQPGELILAERPLISLEGTEGIRRLVEQEHEDLAGGVGTVDMRQVNTLSSQDPRLSEAVAGALAGLDADRREEFLGLSDCFCEEGAGPCPGSWVEVVGEAEGVARGQCGYVVRQDPEGEPPGFYVNVQGEEVRLAGKDLSCMSSGSLGGIFLTNAVSASSCDLAHVYARGSRINHSCCPNAIVLERDRTRRIFAAAAISPGEEICIPYIEDFGHSRHEGLRSKVCSVASSIALDPNLLLVALFRQQLFVKWGFWCQCRRCAPVAAEADKLLQTWCSL